MKETEQTRHQNFMNGITRQIQYQIKCLNDQVLSHSRLLEFIDFLIENPRYFIFDFESGRHVIRNPDFPNDGTGITFLTESCWNLRIADTHTGIVSVITWGMSNVRMNTVYTTVYESINSKQRNKTKNNEINANNDESGTARITSTTPVILTFEDLVKKFKRIE
jgi:hypothetical protein